MCMPWSRPARTPLRPRHRHDARSTLLASQSVGSVDVALSPPEERYGVTLLFAKQDDGFAAGHAPCRSSTRGHHVNVLRHCQAVAIDVWAHRILHVED